MKVKVICEYCGAEIEKEAGHVTRARKLGMGLFCSQLHSALNKKLNKTPEQKKAEKAAYDKRFRALNAQRLKQQKHEAFKKDYAANPEKYKQKRKRRYKAHLEYLRRPEYREYKKEYDEKYRAQKDFGEFAEAALIIKQIENIVDARQTRQDKNCHNKKQKRGKLCNSLKQKS